jgi:hypothetical protein
MLVKDILKLPLNTDLVGQSGYIHKNYRTIETCRKGDVVKVQLVNHNRYQDTWSGWKNKENLDLAGTLVVAPAGAKTFKFLVKHVNNAGDEIFALASPKEIYGLWADAETQWSTANERHRQREEMLQRRRDHENLVVPVATQKKNDMEARIRSVAKDMFGDAKVSVYSQLQSEWYLPVGETDQNKAVFKTKVKGEVTIPIELFEQLIEDALTARYDNA